MFGKTHYYIHKIRISKQIASFFFNLKSNSYTHFPSSNRKHFFLYTSALKLLVQDSFSEGNLGIQILCGGRYQVKCWLVLQQHNEVERRRKYNKGSAAMSQMSHQVAKCDMTPTACNRGSRVMFCIAHHLQVLRRCFQVPVKNKINLKLCTET